MQISPQHHLRGRATSRPTATTRSEPYYFYTPPATGGNALNSPPLHAVPASDTTTNGLYAYTSTPTFPTSSFNATNYWVDPVFTPAPVPGQVTEVSATPQAGAATVSWTAPSTGVATHLHRHPLHRLHSADADHRERLPARNHGDSLGPDPGHHLHVHGAGLQPERRRPGLGALQPGHPPATAPPSPPRGVSASSATNQVLVSWKAPSNEGGSPLTGYTVTPYVGSTAQTAVHASASATSATVSGSHQRHELHVQGHRDQRDRHERTVAGVERR